MISEETITDEYLEWLYDLVCNDEYSNRSTYRTLIRYLAEEPFRYTIPMDGNRAEDGINLRYRFGREVGYHDATIAKYLDIFQCSVLEMMIALALRIEDQIMDDPDLGNRAGQWFWEMIVNLGLGHCNDAHFNKDIFYEAMDRLMDRTYKRNGEGGLFKIHDDRTKDMRSTEIWYQMCWYLDEVINQ